MIPTLTPQGLLAAIVAVTAVLLGIFLTSWPLLCVGQASLAVLAVAYVAALPKVFAVSRERLEFVWRLPAHGIGSFSPGSTIAVRCRLRNRTSAPLPTCRVGVFASDGLQVVLPAGATLASPSGSETAFELKARPRSAGRHFLYGLTLLFVDRFGLVQLQLYFPSTLALSVFPRPAAGRHMPGRPLVGSPLDRAGRHSLRLLGSGTELREIREHRSGDPFRTIDWKATARTGRLMVRQMESEVQGTHYVVLDASATMRSGAVGKRKLDYAVEAASAFARLAVDRGDRVGTVAFDTRVVSHAPPGEGRAHFLRILERLVGLFDLVDEDLTDLTDSELVETVARHIRHQEGVVVRRTDGAALPYDSQALAAAARKLLGRPRSRDRELASSPDLAEIRRYCRERGVPIPYRSDAGFGDKAKGLIAALEAVDRSRQWVHSILLITDLEGLGSWEPIERTLRRLGPGRRPMFVVVPFAPLFVERATDEREKKVRTLLELEEHRRLEDARRRLVRNRARVLVADPEEMPALLYARAAGPR